MQIDPSTNAISSSGSSVTHGARLLPCTSGNDAVLTLEKSASERVGSGSVTLKKSASNAAAAALEDLLLQDEDDSPEAGSTPNAGSMAVDGATGDVPPVATFVATGTRRAFPVAEAANVHEVTDLEMAGIEDEDAADSDMHGAATITVSQPAPACTNADEAKPQPPPVPQGGHSRPKPAQFAQTQSRVTNVTNVNAAAKSSTMGDSSPLGHSSMDDSPIGESPMGPALVHSPTAAEQRNTAQRNSADRNTAQLDTAWPNTEPLAYTAPRAATLTRDDSIVSVTALHAANTDRLYAAESAGDDIGITDKDGKSSSGKKTSGGLPVQFRRSAWTWLLVLGSRWLEGCAKRVRAILGRNKVHTSEITALVDEQVSSHFDSFLLMNHMLHYSAVLLFLHVECTGDS